jgi:hypothetical protein
MSMGMLTLYQHALMRSPLATSPVAVGSLSPRLRASARGAHGRQDSCGRASGIAGYACMEDSGIARLAAGPEAGSLPRG